MKSSPNRAHSGRRSVRPIWRRWPATVTERASRRAGRAMETAAIASPTRAAPTAHRMAETVPAPNDAVPKLVRPISSAAASPTITPRTPANSVSAIAIPTSVRVDAPRVRSSAASRRRRSAPAEAISAVTRPARMAPGSPRKRNRIWAYSASWRAVSSATPRLSPTRPAPVRRLSRLCARAMTSSNAALGLLGERVGQPDMDLGVDQLRA